HRRRPLCPAGGASGACVRFAASGGDRRLLPRPVLRLCRRCRPRAAQARAESPSARRRVPGVASRRAADRGRELLLLRPFLYDERSCASYLFGCGTHARLAVVDPHVDLVDDYVDEAAVLGAPIVAVFETHVQADHVSGLPALVERTGATAYLPVRAGVKFEHVALADGD